MDDDLDALRAERDALRTELASKQRKGRVGATARSLAVTALVVVTVASFLAAALGVWAERNLLDTDRYVEHVAPLAEDPAVQDALARRLSAEIMVLVDPAALFTEALPQRGAVLVAPLTSAVEDFVYERVRAFLDTERFANLWQTANEGAHRRIVQVLRGDASRLEVDGDTVTIDLVPIINEALARIGEASPELLGRSVDLPTLTTDDLPEEARARLAEAFGVPLDDDFGEITVYERGTLYAAQEGIDTFERLRVVSIVLTVGAGALALYLSRRRRRTLLQLLAGMGLGLVLVRRIALTLQSEIVDLARVPANRPAVESIVGVFVDPLVTAAGWILIGLAAIALIAVATAPYPWAVSARREGRRLAGAARRAVTQGGTGGVDRGWLGAHRDGVIMGGGAVLALVLWQSTLSWSAALVAVALFGAFVLVVNRLAGPRPTEAADDTSTGASASAGTKAGKDPEPVDLRVP